VLERRGVDVKNGGAVEGRRVAGEEVRALEALVGVLGKDGKKGTEGEGEGDEMDTGD
jgi:kinetochore protein Mis12/MTW1